MKNIYSFKRIIFIFISGLISGLFISIGGLTNVIALNNDMRAVGSFTFSIGLLLVLLFSSHLYTGKIGFAFTKENRKISYFIDLVIMLIANLLMAYLIGLIFNYIYANDAAMKETITSITNSRSVTDLYSFVKSFVLSLFCGIFVFLACYFYQNIQNAVLKIFLVIFSVFIFVFTGFEHCIANMFYFSLGGSYADGYLFNILTTILGNSLGALFIYGITYFLKANKKDESKDNSSQKN